MTPVVELPLPPDTARFTSLDVSLDGKAVLFGTNTLEGSQHALGVVWVDWAETPVTLRAREVPRSTLPAGLDAAASPIDVDGDRVVVFCSTSSVYGPPHEQIWLLSRTARVGPTLLCDAPGREAALFLSANRRELLMFDGKTFDHLALDTGRRLTLDAEPGRGVKNIALNPAGHQIAWATHERVVCEAIGGERLGEWATPGRLYGLRFADDDLGLWGVTHEAVLQFPIGGAVIPWMVPGRRAVAAHGRLALFAGKAGFCTLDLTSGQATELGTIDAPMHGWCWAAAHRRIATLAHEAEAQILRVFQY